MEVLLDSIEQLELRIAIDDEEICSNVGRKISFFKTNNAYLLAAFCT